MKGALAKRDGRNLRVRLRLVGREDVVAMRLHEMVKRRRERILRRDPP